MVATVPAPSVALAPLPEPLRLPRGSVRGLLAVGLMGTFAYLLLGNTSPPAVLVNAVVVVVAFYFGTRGPATGTVAPATVVPVASRRPRVVRALLLLGFGGLAGWLYWSRLPIRPEFLQVLEVLGGYILGLTLSWFFHRRVHETPGRRRLALVFRDLSAVGALGLTGFACYGFVTGALGILSGDVEQVLSLVITYYFGSRVLAR